MSNRKTPVYSLKRVISEVVDEVCRASEKHPEWPLDDFRALAIVHEELGEAAKAILHNTYEKGSRRDVREEMVQTACTAIRFLMNYDK
jgi:NTP pyrophosphatase (non-canonical NTP hydrolase)